MSAFEQKANNRFELTEEFLKFNMELANEGTNEEKLHLFKKSLRTLKSKIEHSFLSHAERGKRFWILESASKTDFDFLRRGRDSNPR